MIPGTICGLDTDDWLAYTTPKIAVIRDRSVGCCYYFLVTMVLLWVFGFEILMKNKHFLMMDVDGIARLGISHRGVYKNSSELPYCTQYTGDTLHGHNANTQRPCLDGDVPIDRWLAEGSPGSGRIFIPLSFKSFRDYRECEKGADDNINNWAKCEFIRNKSVDEKSLWVNRSFYGDVERHILRLSSTFRRGGIKGASHGVHGFFMECTDSKTTENGPTQGSQGCENLEQRPLECLAGTDCKIKEKDEGGIAGAVKNAGNLLRSKKHVAFIEVGARHQHALSAPNTRETAAEKPLNDEGPTGQDLWWKDRELPDIYKTNAGDYFKLERLLELAGVSLNDDYNVDGYPIRETGTIIEITIMFENLIPWLSSFGRSEVTYTYRIKERSSSYVDREFLTPVQPKDYPFSRSVVHEAGILVVFNIGGQFGFFNVVYLMVMLTTSFALISTVQSLTDVYSMYIHARRKNYFQLKYEVSTDFGDLWTCGKCGFMNIQRDDKCKGVEKWLHKDSEPCGEARPT